MAFCCSLANPPKGILEGLPLPCHASLSLARGRGTPPSPAEGAPTRVGLVHCHLHTHLEGTWVQIPGSTGNHENSVTPVPADTYVRHTLSQIPRYPGPAWTCPHPGMTSKCAWGREDVAGSPHFPQCSHLWSLWVCSLTSCQGLPPTLKLHLDCITVYCPHEWAQQVPRETVCPSLCHRPVFRKREYFISDSFLPACLFFTINSELFKLFYFWWPPLFRTQPTTLLN